MGKAENEEIFVPGIISLVIIVASHTCTVSGNGTAGQLVFLQQLFY